MEYLERLEDKISNNELRELKFFTSPKKFTQVGKGLFLSPQKELREIIGINASHKKFGDSIEVGSRDEIDELTSRTL